ncbi:hypothetical protein HYW82_03210 [Candidatus Peregrinibacteria bacterium]|nr:hypothetical protein [Candidatus Peregrinibacteria bacterium]
MPNQQPQNQEVFTHSAEQGKESKLSPKAKLVHDTMTAYVMEELKQAGIIAEANELYKQGLFAGDPRVEQFFAKCDQASENILGKIRAANGAPNEEYIVYNYFSKLKKSFGIQG